MAGSEHGDARRAIDLLRVAGEIAEREHKKLVTEEHVRMASSKIEENKEVSSLRAYPLHEKLVLLAVVRSKGNSTGEIAKTKSLYVKPLKSSLKKHMKYYATFQNIFKFSFLLETMIQEGEPCHNLPYQKNIMTKCGSVQTLPWWVIRL